MAIVLIYILCIEWPALRCWALTPLYPLLPGFCIIILNMSSYRAELLWLCVITAVHDTAAYIGGSFIGKHKIAPSISPGKSWEGAFIGTAVSLLISYLFIHQFLLTSMPAQLSFTRYSFVTLLLNGAGIAGDLFESFLKRRVGIKDSGRLLPGHGGVLDRVDSILSVATCWTLIRLCFLQV